MFAFFGLSIVSFAQVPTNGLVAYYSFSGNANDLSGNSYNGTVNGATLTADRFGNANSAYSFNGTSDYISVNSAPLTNYPYTISAWIKLSVINNTGKPIIGLGELGTNNLKKCYFDPTYGNTGKPSIGVGGACDITSTSNVVTTGVWTHMVVTVSSYSSSSVTFYVNNVAYTQNTTAGTNVPFPLNNAGFTIGSHKGGGSAFSYFSGVLDDIRIYNRVLSSTEISALYNENNCSSADITTGLVGQYDFSGNANDLSANNYNGTVNGATLTTDRFGNANSAYIFNGTSDYISVNSAPLTNYPYTISAWIKLNTIDNTGKPIIGLGELGTNNLKKCYFDPTYGNTGKPSIGVGGACDITSTSNVVTTGVWTHMVVTVSSYSSSSVTFYVNNVAYTQNTTAGTNVPFPLNNAGFTIGSHKGGGSAFSYFSGVLDDIRIYNRVLTACDVDSLYNMPNSCVTPSTAATPTGTTQLCINPSNTNYTTTGATNATAYVWAIAPSSAGVITGTGTTGTVDWNDTYTGTATISVKGTNGTGCEGAFSNTLTVTINSLPTVTFSSLNSVCANASSFTLSGGSPNGGTYSGTGVSGNIFNPSVSGAGTFTITYIYSDGNGCSNSATQNIVVNPLPNVSISGLNSSYCQNAAAVTLNGTPSGGSFSGAGVNGTNFNPATAGAGSHTITYTATASGCTNSSTQNVTVNAIPTVSFTGLNPSYQTTDSPSTLTGSPAGGVFSGNGISGNVFSPANAGIGSHNIVYVYTDGSGCMNATCETTDLATKVANISSPDNTVNVFPNPNNGSFQVSFNVPSSQNIKIDVYNNIGQSVYTENKSNFFGQYNQTIDLSGLSKGVYLINTTIGGNTHTNKITVE